MGKVLVAIMR